MNLFRLYDTVMALGGWQKVAYWKWCLLFAGFVLTTTITAQVAMQDKWADVAEMLGVGEDIVGGDHAIKLLYMRLVIFEGIRSQGNALFRYLSKYEQIETIGDIDDMLDGEMSRSRGRQVSFFATNECPVGNARSYGTLRLFHLDLVEGAFRNSPP